MDRVATGPWPQAAWHEACGALGHGPGTGGETAVLRALLPLTPGGAGCSPGCAQGPASRVSLWRQLRSLLPEKDSPDKRQFRAEPLPGTREWTGAMRGLVPPCSVSVKQALGGLTGGQQ